MMRSLIKIWENQLSIKGEIIIKTKIDIITHLSCFAATNQITGQHLFIISVNGDIEIPDLIGYRFKGVELFTLPEKTHNDIYIYLIDNDLKDIFALLIQNIIDDISNVITEKECIITALNTISKWKRLFDKISFNGLLLENQKGLIGELLFLNTLLENEKTSLHAVGYWTSTERDFESKDFTVKSIGIEIKFTTSKQPKIKITNEKQLDSDSLTNLFLVLYSAEAVKDNGISLNSLIEETRKKLSTEQELLLFNSKLQLNGYFEQDQEHYNTQYLIKSIYNLDVSDDFPKITKSQLPMGIYDTSYSIEISAIKNFIVESQFLIDKINLCNEH
jgi:hypothetical protein